MHSTWNLFFITGWELQKLDNTYLDIAETFIKEKLDKGNWKVATVKLYLISLNHYLDFVKLGPSTLTMSPEMVKKIQRQIQLWNNYLQKLIAEQNVELQIKDNSN